MKKLIVFLVAFVACFATVAKAQTSLIATLNHEGTMSTFYGSTALQQAHAAAANGDVITLSSGTFHSENITKAITLRGAGMAVNAETQTEPTVLVNAFNINIADETAQRLTIEGIYTNQTVIIRKLKNAMFLKDRFSNLETGDYATDLTFIHCRFAGVYYGSARNENSASFMNCIMAGGLNGSNYTFKNCILQNPGDGGYFYLRPNSEYKNSIIINPRDSDGTMSFYNNLYTGSFDLTKANNTNVNLANEDERIKNLLQYSDDNDYRLTEEAKAIMKGIDGTEVGIYGGNLPYDPTPTNPQITRFNVASKTTADGKLSVDIEVKSAE